MARTKQERRENASKKTRGRCIEVYRLLEAKELKSLGIECDKTVLVRVAGESEGCRDMGDVRAVLTEKDLVGQFVAVRRSGEVIERVMQTVASFVTPKSYEDCKEVAQEEKK